MLFNLFTDNVMTEIDLFLALAWAVCCPISDHMMTLLSIRIFKFSNSRVYLNEYQSLDGFKKEKKIAREHPRHGL